MGGDDRGEIRAILAALNTAWQTRSPGNIAAGIRRYFTDDAVIVGPDLARVARGAQAVCQSYADFTANATLLEARIDDPQIDAFEEIAVATQAWCVSYECAGTRSTQAGHDVYVFSRRADGWRIVWRKVESRPVA